MMNRTTLLRATGLAGAAAAALLLVNCAPTSGHYGGGGVIGPGIIKVAGPTPLPPVMILRP